MKILNTLNGGYIRGLLKEGKRMDARGMMDFRDIKVKAGLFTNAEGSAQADVGGTRVLAGVKMVVEEPMEDTPDQGNMMVNAELLPLASTSYETGPPSPESIEFARVVDRGIRAGNCIDLKSLLIEEKKSWSVFVDLYVLNADGNLFDAGYLAAMSALLCAKVPKYEDGKMVQGERAKSLKIDNIVASTTFGKIGSSLLLDMATDEESIADARLTIATDGNVLRAMQKGMNGSLKVSDIETMIDESFGQYKRLRSVMEKAVKGIE